MTAFFFDHFQVDISPNDLKSPSAKKMLELVQSGQFDNVEFKRCVKSQDAPLEALILVIHVGLGQKEPINDIQSTEEVAITFSKDVSLPVCYPLRENFPFHLPHVNIAGQGYPRSLCLSDQPYEDQLRGYTAAKFLRDVQWWLKETAYDHLHGLEQPLDPLFCSSSTQIISSETLGEAEYVIGYYPSGHETSPICFVPLTSEQYSKKIGKKGLTTPVFIKTPSVRHGQLHYLPSNLLELINLYKNVGVDIVPEFCTQLKSILKRKYKNALLEQHMILIIETEIQANTGQSYIQKKAFITTVSTGQISEHFDLCSCVDGEWSEILFPKACKLNGLADIDIFSADLHSHFTRDLAATYSGYQKVDERSLVLLGAGAIGSHVAMNLARGGCGIWDIIDDDFVLPHNQARYALEPNKLGCAKSDALALVIQELFGTPSAATSHVTKYNSTNNSEEIRDVFSKANAIIDASASVQVARALAFETNLNAPIYSAFMNPAGSDAILLSEESSRSIKIDCVEMHYYWLVAQKEILAGHLQGGDETLPIGGCRSPSARIAETQVSLLSSLISGNWLKHYQRKSANISIWRGAKDFEKITFFSKNVPNFLTLNLGDWTIKISDEIVEGTKQLQQKLAPKETGGIVAGSWDRIRKIIYLVGIYDAPPNSKHSTTGFHRGSVGVFKSINDLERSTLGNLTYVGEWHSHPPGVSANPSKDDRILIKWIRSLLDSSEAPAIMLIVGEDGLRIILREDERDLEELIGQYGVFEVIS